jgi:hypothetical protein
MVSLKRTLWRKICDPCDLIGRFQHTGFFATQGWTLNQETLKVERSPDIKLLRVISSY